MMLIYGHSLKFQPTGTQDGSVKFLNRLRNQFVHFTPMVWALELEGLPAIFVDSLDIAEFLAWQSNNVFWTDAELKNRVKLAFTSARKSLETLTMVLGSGHAK